MILIKKKKRNIGKLFNGDNYLTIMFHFNLIILLRLDQILYLYLNHCVKIPYKS